MENPTAAEADAYRYGIPSRRLILIAATSPTPRQPEPPGAERDEEQPEEHADRQRSSAPCQGHDQDRNAEPDDGHREDPDRQLITLVGRGALVHWPELRSALGDAATAR